MQLRHNNREILLSASLSLATCITSNRKSCRVLYLALEVSIDLMTHTLFSSPPLSGKACIVHNGCTSAFALHATVKEYEIPVNPAPASNPTRRCEKNVTGAGTNSENRTHHHGHYRFSREHCGLKTSLVVLKRARVRHRPVTDSVRRSTSIDIDDWALDCSSVVRFDFARQLVRH
jgi:hypothetical protein